MNQSRHDRLKRLNRGRCPIHGLGVVQASPWYCAAGKGWGAEHTTCDHWKISKCPRSDCDARVRVWDGDTTDPMSEGPYELVNDWDELPEGYPQDDSDRAVN